jgi:hypothetical protein
MLRAFEALAIRLQTVAQPLEQPRHHLHARGVPVVRERGHEVALAPRGPQQRRLRIAARRRLDERLQIGEQRRVFLRRQLPSAARPTTAGGRQSRRGPALDRAHLGDPAPDDARGHARRAGCRRDAAVPEGHRLAGDEQAASALRQLALHFPISHPDLRFRRHVRCRSHAHSMLASRSQYKCLFCGRP